MFNIETANIGVELEMLTIPEHMSIFPIFSGVSSVTQSLV